MCNSSDTCLTLGTYLSSLSGADGGSKDFLESKLNSYFFWKASMGKLQKSLKRTPGFNKGERRSSSSSSSTNGASSSSSSSTAGAFAASKSKPDASGSAAVTEGELSAALKRKDWKRGSAPSAKRRRVRGGGAVGATGSAGHAAAGGAGGSGQGIFAAATGANPEALEEDAQKFAEMCGFFSRSLLLLFASVLTLPFPSRTQHRRNRYPRRRRPRQCPRGGVQRDGFPGVLRSHLERRPRYHPAVPRRRGRQSARGAQAEVCGHVRPESIVREED